VKTVCGLGGTAHIPNLGYADNASVRRSNAGDHAHRYRGLPHDNAAEEDRSGRKKARGALSGVSNGTNGNGPASAGFLLLRVAFGGDQRRGRGVDGTRAVAKLGQQKVRGSPSSVSAGCGPHGHSLSDNDVIGSHVRSESMAPSNDRCSALKLYDRSWPRAAVRRRR
jgi:hypothetical protein